ncbi:hypothetical protein [Hymenobacter metallicola]|uniref:Uncharacterized protein n=1 Tax=Hymenobacter metallicola TaxID=2563114 RepID=A0A4Z0QI29_9BACT|nr:hypothetical protein [Hymenobacter metallicola]TGE29727.1 hypothetical protein E5K02_09790 [Hymenobacter metallicola]
MLYLFGLRWEAYNTERSVYYDAGPPRRITFVDAKIDPDRPRLTPSGPPDGGYNVAPGAVVLEQFCEETTGIAIYAQNAAPHAYLIVDATATACAAPSADTLEVSKMVNGAAVTFSFTTDNPPVRYSPNDINYGDPITSPYTLSYPNGSRMVYFKDAANSRREISFIINVDTGGGGGEPVDPRPGEKLFDFEAADGGLYDVYYEAGSPRKIMHYYNGGGAVNKPVVTAEELGFEDGEEITFVCEANNTKVLFRASLDKPFATFTAEANSVECGYVDCSLSVSGLQVYQPTQTGDLGGLRVIISTEAISFTVSITQLADNTTEFLTGAFTPGPFQLYNLKSGAYRLNVTDANGCQASVDYTITAFVPPVEDPDPLPATRWHAVGGLLPRPALLATPVTSLTDTNNEARFGLHVEVELTREGDEQPFARLRKTARQLTEVVDVSTLLHAQLRPELAYPQGIVTPDRAAFLDFRYRYREVDALGVADWVAPPGLQRAALCALPIGPFDENNPNLYVASAQDPAYLVMAFPSGQAVQWVGLPQEVTVWLPDAREADLFAEFVYRDAAGAELEIKTLVVARQLPAGVTRIPLPANVLPCAATVTFRLTDTDRAYAGSCVEAGPVDPPATAHDFNISDLSDNDFR